MVDTFNPENEDHVLDVVRWAVSNQPDQAKSLEIVGQGTKRGLGSVVQADAVVTMSGVSGITLYEPEELVMTARAGTPVVEIQAALDEANQMMAFEPWLPGPLYDQNGGTIGGLFATAMCGPRRPLSGSARDHLLGFHAISGRGETFKSGGRVVKNVTGFDLSKLMTGSMGTLAIMTEVTFKVLPGPQKARTILVLGADDPNRVMRDAQNSPYEVSGVAHLPQSMAARSSVSYVNNGETCVTAIRVEGPAPSVDVRCPALQDLLSGYGDIRELHTSNTVALWQEIRDASFFDDTHQIWRLSVTPSQGITVASELTG